MHCIAGCFGKKKVLLRHAREEITLFLKKKLY